MTKITIPDTADLVARTSQEPAAAPPPTELERVKAELHLMKTAGVIEIAIRNPSVSEYMAHWEGRATKAEARFTALERALDEIITEATSRNHAIDIARRARAEGAE